MNLNLAELNFSRNDWGQLVVRHPDGTEYHGVEPIRCFPLTDPDGMIAIIDSEGRELFNLQGLRSLNSNASEVLKKELAEREFTPVIRRIIATGAPYPPCRWYVDTDRGQAGFQVESEDDIRRLGTSGAVIADSNGIRYKIPNIELLDAPSQRVIRRLV